MQGWGWCRFMHFWLGNSTSASVGVLRPSGREQPHRYNPGSPQRSAAAASSCTASTSSHTAAAAGSSQGLEERPAAALLRGLVRAAGVVGAA